jgi:hypothetical protein
VLGSGLPKKKRQRTAKNLLNTIDAEEDEGE